MPVSEGSLIGRIQIPRIHLSAIVLEGTSDRTLRLAVGHVPGTALPGEPGNVGIAGHRDTFFRGLRKIRQDDIINFATINGTAYQYRVGSIAVVSPDNTKILEASNSKSGMDLVTCYPFHYVGPAPKRYVVYANQVEGR